MSLEGLDRDALVRILKEPKNALVKQYQKLFDFDDVKLTFEEDAIKAIADQAFERKTGARGLRSIMEKAMMDVMYRIPSDETIVECIITKDAMDNAVIQCKNIIAEREVTEGLKAKLQYFELLYSCYYRFVEEGRKKSFGEYCDKANIEFVYNNAYYYNCL